MGTGGGLIVIDFSEQGNSAHFRGEGWSGQETYRVWGIGPRSVLRVQLQSFGRSMVLEAELGPCNGPAEIGCQIVHIRVNGTAVGSARLEALSVLRCEIEPALARPDGILEIEFECPGFYVPAGLGDSEDQRPLSCWFNLVRLYTIDMFGVGPDFPASEPDIPRIAVRPSFADANSRAAPEVYSFGRVRTALTAEPDDQEGDENEFSVTEGSSGQLKLLSPRIPGAYVLRVDACPLLASCEPPQFDTTISVDGLVIGQISIREPSAWLMLLPRELTEKRDILRLNFRLRKPIGHAEFVSPESTRRNGIAVTRISILPRLWAVASATCVRAEEIGMLRPITVSHEFLTETTSALPIAIEAALGTDLLTLLRGFESLGGDDEFGVVQRKLGLEVLNLFRFCESTLTGLIQALTDDLKAATDPDHLTVDMQDAEHHALTLQPYELHWPAFVSEIGADPEARQHANSVTLGYLRRKFYEGLRTGRKIYVMKQRRPLCLAELAVLMAELNRYGNATLLCVAEAQSGQLQGAVELLLPGLMRGYVGHFAPDTDVEAAEPADWLRVLANATLLQRRLNPTVAH
jgi:hypothetical protein